jgi:Ca2+-binding RTX toxin-like protein
VFYLQLSRLQRLYNYSSIFPKVMSPFCGLLKMNLSFRYVGSLLSLVLAAIIGTTMMMAGSSSISQQAWADVIEGTEGDDRIAGTPGDDIIDGKGGSDNNFGDTVEGDGSGDDVIVSGEGNDKNFGDSQFNTGSGQDKIITGEGDDQSTGNGGADIFICGGGDTVSDYNEAEGDIATPDCE